MVIRKLSEEGEARVSEGELFDAFNFVQLLYAFEIEKWEHWDEVVSEFHRLNAEMAAEYDAEVEEQSKVIH